MDSFYLILTYAWSLIAMGGSLLALCSLVWLAASTANIVSGLLSVVECLKDLRSEHELDRSALTEQGNLTREHGEELARERAFLDGKITLHPKGQS
jgi:hypothetical protein